MKHPEIILFLGNSNGPEGNALSKASFLLRARQAMRKGNLTEQEIDEYTRQATGSDYDNLLAITAEWVDVR